MEYNIENFNKKISEIEKEKEIKIIAVNREFAFANNPYKIGDIITDNIGSIKIESIKFSISSFGELPCCVYYGVELKKDLSPVKRLTKRGVYQTNIITEL